MEKKYHTVVTISKSNRKS